MTISRNELARYILATETKVTTAVQSSPQKAVSVHNSLFRLKSIENFTEYFQTSLPTLTEDEIKYFFHNDTEAIKRSFKQCDVQNVFVRASDSDNMPDVTIHFVHISLFVNHQFSIDFKLLVTNA